MRLDPQFAQAWAALSRAHASVYFLQIDASPARKEAAETAMRLSPTSSATLLAFAYYRYHVERDYEGARVLFAEMFERALAISPDDPEVLTAKAKLLQTMGNLPAARAVLARIPANAEGKTDEVRSYQFLCERRYEEAARMVQASLEKQQADAPDGRAFSAAISRRTAGALAGDAEGAKQEFLAAKAGSEMQMTEQPTNLFIASAAAFAEAGLGNKEAALREAARAVSLLPVSEDPVYGPIMEEYQAGVEAQVGEIESAITRIERLLTTPYGAFPLPQAILRIDPTWDPLRQHPRFKALVEGTEPKTIYR